VGEGKEEGREGGREGRRLSPGEGSAREDEKQLRRFYKQVVLTASWHVGARISLLSLLLSARHPIPTTTLPIVPSPSPAHPHAHGVIMAVQSFSITLECYEMRTVELEVLLHDEDLWVGVW